MCTLVPLMLIGNWIRSSIEKRKQEQQQTKIRLINEAILDKRNDLCILDDSLSKIVDILSSHKERENIIGQIKKREEGRDRLRSNY